MARQPFFLPMNWQISVNKRGGPHSLRHEFLYAGGDFFVLAVGEEQLAEMRTGERTLDQFPIQLPQDVAQVAEGHGAHTVQNLLVALFGHGALTGIALSGRLAEQLFKNVLQIQIAAPAKAFGEGQGDGVAIVDLGEGVGVQRVGHMTADDAGEAVQRQHGALAGAAAGDDVVRRAGVEQHRGQNAVLHVGQLGGVIGGILATLGVVFPSLVIICILAGLISNFAELAVVQNAFAGIKVCVCVLILNAVLKLLKKSVIDVPTFVIFLIVMLGAVASDLLGLGISPVVYVLLAAAAGLVIKQLEVKKP